MRALNSSRVKRSPLFCAISTAEIAACNRCKPVEVSKTPRLFDFGFYHIATYGIYPYLS